ncbi:MAG TPA: phospho-N-acetylmuramoyl-pentapeptide-transferase [Thermodesulfobacteriota bacterium]|nr:phospho-N-acetylmuramoyl-pentapeptide-transferase [Thermodesulfobacteriota bacterium]
MFYHLLYPLAKYHMIFNVFQYITFRTIYAAVTALVVSFVVGPYIIKKLKVLQISEVIRKDGPASHHVKAGTPTMGGTIILVSIMVSALLWANFNNNYVWLTIFVILSLGAIGFVDDYRKVILKDKRGLPGRWKFFWQAMIGIAAAVFLYTSDFDTVIAIPFFKGARLDMGLLYIPFVAFIIIGSSNAVNLTDGLDGLAIGPMVIAAGTYMLFAYFAGHVKIAAYLQIPYVAGAGELTVIAAAMVGASLGFLWFNTYPAQVFMGDIGSLSLGGGLGILAVVTKNEMVLILVGGIFVMEALSVIFQVASYKLRGKRVFAMAPIHHHFELKGWPEPRIIVRFWIIAIMLSLIAISTLKLR